ncbi:MAG: MarR family transcriptional regulator, partial [Sporomusaceae bacterium]|nr:MarR family transcriptional regulator [Sporomusaceae bacterium]
KAYDLTAEQSETLLFFDLHKKALILDLKGHLRISHQAARNLVERMKKKGLLYVEVSPNDGRARLVCLTEKGQKTCDSLKRAGTSVGHKLLEGISDEDRKWILSLLEQLSKNME